jgi:hypothetical protein
MLDIIAHAPYARKNMDPGGSFRVRLRDTAETSAIPSKASIPRRRKKFGAWFDVANEFPSIRSERKPSRYTKKNTSISRTAVGDRRDARRGVEMVPLDAAMRSSHPYAAKAALGKDSY